MNGPTVCGEPYADRLTHAVNHRLPIGQRPTLAQIAAVLHALADVTALEAALRYRRETGNPDSISVGRWLHDTADQLTGDPR